MATEAMEDFADSLCSPCQTENMSVTALSFCNECQEYLCLSCVKHHMKLGLTKHHQLTKTADQIPVLKNEESKHVDERCIKHNGKVIGMFCSFHEEIGCHECMANDHGHCGEIIYIPDKAKGIASSSEFQVVREDLENTRDRLRVIRNDRQNDLDRLGAQRDTIMNSLRDIKQRTTNKLEAIEAASEALCQKRYEENVSNIQTDVFACNSLSNILDTMTQVLKSTSDETTLFLHMMRAKRNISAGLKMINSASWRARKQRLSFHQDSRVEHLFDGLKVLGQINTIQRLYNAVGIGAYDVNVVSDKEKSDVMMYGCAFLSDGRIVVSDFSNKRLKILNTGYKVTSCVELCGSPSGVCTTGNNEVAVCIFDKCLIQFVNVRSCSRPTRSFKTELNCQGIEFYGNQLYVTVTSDSKNHVRIYSISGSLQHILEQNVFTRINQIACCPFSETLYITDTMKGVLCLSTKGSLLAEIKDTEIMQPTGISPDGNGGFFVAGFKTNNVVHFGQDGAKVKIILTDKDGIKEPLSLCFDSSLSKLTVTLAGSKNVHLFQLLDVTNES